MSQQRKLCIVLTCFLVITVSACQRTPQPETLYQEERVALERQTTKFRSWAESVVTIIRENDQDLEAAMTLIESEQSKDLDDTQTAQFDRLQQHIESRRDEITQLFEQGELIQYNLFSSFYTYFGKLDAGAEFCGHVTIDLGNIDLPAIVNQSSWPQLEDNYISAFRNGKQALSAEGNFQCDVFVSRYDSLRDDVEENITDINELLNTLDF